MLLTNYHMHTKFCDGLDEPEQYANEAIIQKIKVLGYSAHAPVPFPCVCTLSYENYPIYLETINLLKTKFDGKLEICCGLEIDYIPGMWPQMKKMLEPHRLDYFIGSIHFVDAFTDGTPWSIDGTNKEFHKGWTEIFQQDSHNLIRKYFEYTRQMIREMKPPIIGHLDKIKMQYQPDCFIPETDTVYREELMNTLEEIRPTNCVVEINTRGVYKRNEAEFYPSAWVIAEMAKWKIPAMINSDAHHPHEITLLYHTAIEKLRLAGYRHIYWLSKGTWREESI